MTTEWVKAYESIADNTLEKTFCLRPSPLKPNNDDDDELNKQLLNEKLELEYCKEQVHEKCNKIGYKTWRSHTMFTHPLKAMAEKLKNEYSTVRPSISQAYCKFAEILSSYPELTQRPKGPYETPFRSLHLCEAPGCFVQAMADFLPEQRRADWVWRMNSLNPYYEGGSLDRMIYDDSFMLPYHKNILFGPDDSGSITNWTDEYISLALGETGRFHTITYDGSFDCTDNPSEQENSVHNLILHAWRITMKMLHKNGCAVFKIYTFFSNDMRTFLNQFHSMFQTVWLRKPACSKPGNSEVYLIGINYRDLEPINQDSGELKYIACQAAKYFVKHQTDMINFNLSTVARLSQTQRMAISRKKQDIETVVSSRYMSFLQLTVLSKPFLRELSVTNIWKNEAWREVGHKYDSYDEYVLKSASSSSPTSSFATRITWPVAIRRTLKIDEICLNSIVRHEAVVVTQRSTRFNPVEPPLRTTSSLFADYKLMHYAREHHLEHTDMTKRNSKAFKQLRIHFVHQQDTIFIDSSFMNRGEWLELCYLVACGSISAQTLLPQSTVAVSLPLQNYNLSIRNVQLYLPFGSTFILSRFAGSVIFFLALFFEKMQVNERGVQFSGYIEPSEELGTYIKRVYQDIPSSYEILQFVPTQFFTNSSVYSTILSYNNHALRIAVEAQRKRLGGHPKSLALMG